MQNDSDKKERRITVVVSDELHRKARLKSVETGKSMSEVIREALEKWTANKDRAEP